MAYIPYDPNQVLGVSGSYMGNSQLVQRPGPTVQQSANSYYNATSAGNFYLQNNSAFQFIHGPKNEETIARHHVRLFYDEPLCDYPVQRTVMLLGPMALSHGRVATFHEQPCENSTAPLHAIIPSFFDPCSPI